MTPPISSYNFLYDTSQQPPAAPLLQPTTPELVLVEQLPDFSLNDDQIPENPESIPSSPAPAV